MAAGRAVSGGGGDGRTPLVHSRLLLALPLPRLPLLRSACACCTPAAPAALRLRLLRSVRPLLLCCGWSSQCVVSGDYSRGFVPAHYNCGRGRSRFGMAREHMTAHGAEGLHAALTATVSARGRGAAAVWRGWVRRGEKLAGEKVAQDQIRSDQTALDQIRSSAWGSIHTCTLSSRQVGGETIPKLPRCEPRQLAAARSQARRSAYL